MVTFSTEKITPTMAAAILENNKSNRPIRHAVVDRYVLELLEGRWKPGTGETIKISESGKLLDGQHRLTAIVKSGVSATFHIARGVDDSMFSVIDTGSVRNASDVFFINGIGKSNAMPSIIQTAMNIKSGVTARQGRWRDGLTNAQLLASYQNNPDYWNFVCQRALHWYDSFAKILPPSLIGGLFSTFHDINPDDSQKFMEQLCTGQDITNKVIALLRTRLMQDKMSTKRMIFSIRLALILKAWNVFRNNEKITQLKYDAEREKFPVPI